MAPSAIVEISEANQIGQDLEHMSDAIDDVNCMKYDAASKFDSAKDKTQFRQYEDACDRVKNFYRENRKSVV